MHRAQHRLGKAFSLFPILRSWKRFPCPSFSKDGRNGHNFLPILLPVQATKVTNPPLMNFNDKSIIFKAMMIWLTIELNLDGSKTIVLVFLCFSLVYTTQVISAFCASWFASSEVNTEYYSPPSKRRKTNWLPRSTFYRQTRRYLFCWRSNFSSFDHLTYHVTRAAIRLFIVCICCSIVRNKPNLDRLIIQLVKYI